jgi:cell wall-associated NlpC family hydrolase
MTLRPNTPVEACITYIESLEAQTDSLAAMVKELQSAPKPTPAWEVKANTVLSIAKALDSLGIPYVFGGETLKGMDCSGFTQFIFKQVGITLPRVSKDQGKIGTQIDKKNSSLWRKGDLITFDYSKDGTVDHIGIYMGNGTMIHTNTPATGINVKAVTSASTGLVGVNRVL